LVAGGGLERDGVVALGGVEGVCAVGPGAGDRGGVAVGGEQQTHAGDGVAGDGVADVAAQEARAGDEQLDVLYGGATGDGEGLPAGAAEFGAGGLAAVDAGLEADDELAVHVGDGDGGLAGRGVAADEHGGVGDGGAALAGEHAALDDHAFLEADARVVVAHAEAGEAFLGEVGMADLDGDLGVGGQIRDREAAVVVGRGDGAAEEREFRQGDADRLGTHEGDAGDARARDGLALEVGDPAGERAGGAEADRDRIRLVRRGEGEGVAAVGHAFGPREHADHAGGRGIEGEAARGIRAGFDDGAAEPGFEVDAGVGDGLSRGADDLTGDRAGRGQGDHDV